MNDLFSNSTAELSPCGLYRYTLTRQWEDGGHVTWVMCNPSTADATEDDATIRKCIGFSQRWGFGRLTVVNLFAIRSTNPARLKSFADPVGPMNNYWIHDVLTETREVILAWGCGQHITAPHLWGQQARVREIVKLAKVPMFTLGKRNDGVPRHPLMLSYTTERQAEVG